MAKILDMPKLSPTMEEGVLSAWHKKEGDTVEVDDLLAEVETDKATMEFRAFDRGTILKILVSAGATVQLGQPVAVIGNAGEDIASLLAKIGTAPHQTKTAPPVAEAKSPEKLANPAPATTSPDFASDGAGPSTEPPRAMRAPRTSTPPTGAPAGSRGSSPLDRTERDDDYADDESAQNGPTGTGDKSRILASPFVRKNARERGIDLSGAHGTGPQGRIAMKDLDALDREMKSPNGPMTLQAPGMSMTALAAPEARPLSMMRKTIAKRLVEAKREIPHFYLSIDVDADNLVKLRETVNRELESAGSPNQGGQAGDKPFKISVNDLLIKACAVALVRVPECNAQFSPEAILIHKRVDISVAVAIPDGLVTPVIRDADKKGVLTIAHEVRDLAARARSKKLKPEEMRDGTFSISNLGMFGIDNFSAVINPPEGAILAVGQVREEPIVKDGRLAVGKKLAMTLSCDHRVIDGAVGASFLAELRALIEHPMRVLSA
ncbi:MAG: pyruvate dehydrogenase complex dihydrolipoamide acetyltransferase [Polyangiaceae bacterium]